jgi:hypothetical protein
MAKTKGKYIPGEFSFKLETKAEKFAFMVYGNYMETTAVSEGQARNAIKARYNKANGRNSAAWVDMTPTAVRNLTAPLASTVVKPTTAAAADEATEKYLSPKEGIQYLFDLLEQK